MLKNDDRKKRIKTLDEYYHIKGNITSDYISKDILEHDKNGGNKRSDSSQSLALLAGSVPVVAWLNLVMLVSMAKLYFVLSLFFAGSVANSTYWFLLYGKIA